MGGCGGKVIAATLGGGGGGGGGLAASGGGCAQPVTTAPSRTKAAPANVARRDTEHFIALLSPCDGMATESLHLPSILPRAQRLVKAACADRDDVDPGRDNQS